jgi:hypothetical protein
MLIVTRPNLLIAAEILEYTLPNKKKTFFAKQEPG